MQQIDILEAGFDDIVQLLQLARQTFLETFAAGNSEDTMVKYLDEGFSVAKLDD